MARIKDNQRYKTLDGLLKKKEERIAEEYSGYRWTIDQYFRDGIISNANELELLVCVADYEFFSFNIIRKRFPMGAAFIYKTMKSLEQQQLIKEAMSESEVSISKRMGEGESTHIHIESRKIRKRYRLTQKGIDLVRQFITDIKRNGRILHAPEERKDDNILTRLEAGQAKPVMNGGCLYYRDEIPKPFASDSTIYYEEESYIDAWYEQKKNKLL